MTMEPIKITLARRDGQLKQILELQRINALESLDADTAKDQGFVTARHDLPLLQRMNASAAAVIALRERKLQGYCLAMTREFSQSIPSLAILFEKQDAIVHRGELLGEVEYLVMGQVCVAEEARGQKLADRMYKYLRACYHLRFPYCLTAIDARNTRSQRVHERIGFEELARFTAPDGRNWILIIWNWRDGMEGF
ncbi:GNAT family N-acetyltransferase [Lewinella sp. JB7]|uniref:GNAT family N-acetyltransferase n=1 Tax=Lewinella sp. JB7 TaxID=2962887 RepID=UPI0020C98A6A|nr:GNAT family N-acetyltransferase [Lewinella sp. JB7]MCP9236967.1 GNAT family N-acetyltransferase [Lewinella sp. JB7]